MNPAYIRELCDYTQWADRRVFSAAAKLNPEKVNRHLGNSFSSVRETLVHIMAAEWIWLERWKGTSPKALLPASEFATLDSLRQRWDALHAELAQYTGGVSADQLQSDLAYINTRGQQFSYPLWRQMAHVVNHSTYHRGQITTMLRQLGAEPVSTDLLVYWDEKVKVATR